MWYNNNGFNNDVQYDGGYGDVNDDSSCENSTSIYPYLKGIDKQFLQSWYCQAAVLTLQQISKPWRESKLLDRIIKHENVLRIYSCFFLSHTLTVCVSCFKHKSLPNDCRPKVCLSYGLMLYNIGSVCACQSSNTPNKTGNVLII
jgi:hypothetical protein